MISPGSSDRRLVVSDEERESVELLEENAVDQDSGVAGRGEASREEAQAGAGFGGSDGRRLKPERKSSSSAATSCSSVRPSVRIVVGWWSSARRLLLLDHYRRRGP